MADSLLSNQRTQALIDRVTARIATGRDVNTVIDNPQNYFAADGLNKRAADITRRLDGIGQSINTINQAINGTRSAEDLLLLGESIALNELEKRRNGIPFAEEAEPITPLNEQILEDNPVAYWRLNETAGPTAENLGSIGVPTNGTYRNGPTLGADALHDNGGSSVEFDGTNQYISIPGNGAINTQPQTQRSVELVFNANTTAGRQVLYEEGGTVNSLTIYIDNGRLYTVGRDNGAWGPQDISIPINAGETYHVSFSMSSITGEFIGYLNGQEIDRDVVTETFPQHGGDVAIGAMRNGAWFHNGSNGGNNHYFNGRISDVAIYNSILDENDMAERAAAVLGAEEPSTENDNFNVMMDQLTELVGDASYQGVNLLTGDDLVTVLNEDGSHKYTTKGLNLTSEGLDIKREGFDTETGILEILGRIRNALKQIRAYRDTLAMDFGILQTRDAHARDRINVHVAGADKLTLADINEEGANLLALQTRQQLSITSLSLASQSSRTVLDLFSS